MPITTPFIGTEALAAGRVNRWDLARNYKRVFRGVYVAAGTTLSARDKALAAWLFSGRSAVVAGRSAAALYGARWIPDDALPELTRTRVACPGLIVRRDILCDDEICTRYGLLVTTLARTAFDIGRRRDLTQAVVELDALANATGVTENHVLPLVDRHRGARWVVTLRRALDLMDAGAESPPETLLRLLIIEAGFPRPQTQIWVRDETGYRFARIDMGWAELKIGVEYDGLQHWEDPKQRAWDIERIAKLEALGWIIIRVSSDLLYNRPEVVLARIRDAFNARRQ